MKIWFIDIYWVYCSVAADALAPYSARSSTAMVFNICPCVWSFPFSEFRLYWWIRVLDSVKCPSFLTNYKAFSATKTPWVELCLGSVGEKEGHKILNSLKYRKPVDNDQSLNCCLVISIQNRLYVHCFCLLWNYRHFGLVAILEYTPFCIGRHIEISAILDPM